MKDELEKLLNRGVDRIYPSKEAFEKVLRSGKKLKLYQGFDPSMPSLHLGNYVGALKLSQFQKLGHKVIFLVGDFTGMIGDPSDKLAVRKKLTREEVLQNSKIWKDQVSRMLDFDGPNPAEIKYNSDWLDKVTFKELIEITSNFTVQQMIERDMFQERIKNNTPIYLHEFLYPVSVAIDCVEMDVDLEIGGTDQTFNMLAGRTLMKALKNKDKYVLTTKLLVDKDGNKIGKTTGNALFLDSTPENFFAGIMSFPDEVIELGFELLTEFPLEGLKKQIDENPLNMKKRLAFKVVNIIWGKDDAKNSQEYFERTVQKGDLPKELDTLQVSNTETLLDAVAKYIGSKSEAKRLLQQKAIEVNEKVVTEPGLELKGGEVLKIGKKTFVKIKTK
ncbi:MAG: Tyrosine-tRNA ligase [Microgenomates group bacterium GW2011_GWC1_37_8]|uniref:Tyrosine--tRNA ligase n=1 Tax=Candidatus Woesebacteria bacterium GW2011_GWB1_38_8 TaxID=1618570 RepID=A0A0G0NIZ8_9BACT|nr:MAG: Tyrosine-tRNA ligase [Microgenomates group bacterium GW2011_GWC1_37_8]KKQ85879.1 MAG: Tyrosine-tRNA ligase [Candidatus Woesebacteria bacterium GW2011_GWB1_38_8]